MRVVTAVDCGRRYWRALYHRDFAAWLWQRVWLDDIAGRAAQLSYYFLLSLFPLLIFLSSVLGYFFARDMRLEQRLLEHLGPLMPGAAFEVIRATAEDLLLARGGGKLSFGLLAAIWMASSGMEAVIEGLNVAFQVRDPRPWWRRRMVALLLTICVAILAGSALGVTLAGGLGGQWVMDALGLGDVWSPLWQVLQQIAAIVFLLLAIALVYYAGPNLKSRRKRLVVVPGAVVALVCWLAASAGLRFYLDHFSTFGKTYGSLGAVIALLLWLYLTGATLLLGAEINSGIDARLRSA
jgi:membrane protein